MKYVFLACALAVSIMASNPAQTFSGTITDTMCGKAHGMDPGQPDDKCVRMCVKNSNSQYALFDGSRILKLSDQKTPAKFAAQRVVVTGVLDEKNKTIKVTSIASEGAAQ